MNNNSVLSGARHRQDREERRSGPRHSARDRPRGHARRGGGGGRRLGLGQVDAARDPRRPRHADAAARSSSTAPTCSRSTRTARAELRGRTRRLRVPVVPAAAGAHRAGERDAAAGARRTPTMPEGPAQRDARRASAWASGCTTIRSSSPAASSSASRWRAPSSCGPKLLLADEPTGSLDADSGAERDRAAVRA